MRTDSAADFTQPRTSSIGSCTLPRSLTTSIRAPPTNRVEVISNVEPADDPKTHEQTAKAAQRTNLRKTAGRPMRYSPGRKRHAAMDVSLPRPSTRYQSALSADTLPAPKISTSSTAKRKL